MLSERIKKVEPSATLKITATAKQMKKEGKPVINFGAGEPDFDTPEFIKDSAIKAIKEGKTKYTPATGLIELKEAVVSKIKKDLNVEYKKENIIITVGAKHALYNIMQAMVNPGDEVILFSPYWVSYKEQVNLASGIPVFVDTTKNNFKIDFDELKKKISSKTKLILLNSPQNPTGVVYSKEEIEKLAEIVMQYKNLYIISDEIYDKLIYDNKKHFSITQISKEIKDRTFLVNGVSKTYAMTGWRIGYLAAKEEFAKAIGNLQSHSTSNPTTFCQIASITALEQESEEIDKMIKKFEERRDLIYNKIKEIEEFKVEKPKGAFYIFPDISNVFNKRYKDEIIDSSFKFAEILLKEKYVAVVPGVAFGTDKYIRLSFATSDEDIIEGVNRIKDFIKELK